MDESQWKLPMEILEKISLLISDHRTMSSWLNYLPILKDITSVDTLRRSLRKKRFMSRSVCRCFLCWKQMCRGDENIAYFRT